MRPRKKDGILLAGQGPHVRNRTWMLAWCLLWETTARADAIAQRFAPPAGYARIDAHTGEFAHWLRQLTLKPEGEPVRLFDGRLKANQSAHLAVIDVSVGKRDLQQCADALMRLRADYLWAVGRGNEICFHLTSGRSFGWRAWEKAHGANSRSAYLHQLFAFAGSASLAKFDVESVPDNLPQPGDLFIVGGFPGHAVLVVDVIRNERGQTKMLLAQSYMPAQDIHVLNNPNEPGQPWYHWEAEASLVTPEWTFPPGALRRFKPHSVCR